MGPAAQGRGPRPHHAGQEPMVRACPRAAVACGTRRQGRRADQRPGRRLVLEHMAKGIGQWGMFEALDGEAAAALIATAEDWLREQGMKSALGPISLSIWDEPGLEIEGFAEPPTAMMGHHRPEYQAWIEAAGYGKAKDLADLRGRHRPLGGPDDQPPDRDGRAQPAHPHPRDRQVEVRRGSAADPQPAQRSLVGQLGLCPADRGGDRLCRQEIEADHLQRAGARSPRSTASRSPSC